MAPISALFGNPAVKILEQRLWESARKRYLQEHPSERDCDATSVMKKTRSEYQLSVARSVEDADHKVRAIWGEFRLRMLQQVRAAFRVVLRMSDIDWYAVEAGEPGCPEAIAVPYELLKHMTGALLFQSLRNEIAFDSLHDETLQALSNYAVGERFDGMLEQARRNYNSFEIGEHHAPFVVAEHIKRDSYYLDEEAQHSRIDTVIFSCVGASSSDDTKKNRRSAVTRWFGEHRKNRKNDRRFSGDGWEITFEELKSWASA